MSNISVAVGYEKAGHAGRLNLRTTHLLDELFVVFP
jgi:hypothetical protein